MTAPVLLVTGAARRIGATLARSFHQAGFNVALHCHQSIDDAQRLANALNAERQNSANVFQAALDDLSAVKNLAKQVVLWQGRLDCLINNASSFYPTPLESADNEQWNDLLNSNLKGPYFLCQALAGPLRESAGSIINIADIYARSPLKGYSIYCIAKAGNAMMTKALATELAPIVRVNGIAPGVILWPHSDGQMNDDLQQQVISKVPLQRIGDPEDIARTALFLATRASYLTGQVIAVDGGSSLNS
ncbi:pteridine reductase [Porticoccus litoralis]|uniref:Pteridine reductase n=1 Tax=Porticoccus litoralis TaxID=434086 RepID=A0AAW8B5P4_9GAMM|nr:pteridine reductase [Porticoccus litoralis]MDP1521019.1 pteridine reductase [Porticoccus litoralis]